MMRKITRALISCSDKSGLDFFAKGLVNQGIEIIASGGTAAFLNKQGIASRTVEDFAGISEQLDGRVKTLHPKIHAGILAKRSIKSHIDSVGEDFLIDMVVVNLYPFTEAIKKPGISLDEALEQVDIGGVALLRAAAKNFPDVCVICDPAQYPKVLDEMNLNKGNISDSFKKELAISAFRLTSSYDECITNFLSDGQKIDLSEKIYLEASKVQALRYGENPHQGGAWYSLKEGQSGGLCGLVQIQGKELSYNNLLDVDTAVRCLLDFHEPTCVIVKHASPCGIASSGSVLEAYKNAYKADSESAFGGIIGINISLDAESASSMISNFIEVIVASEILPEAKEVVSKKPNVRLVELKMPKTFKQEEWHSVLGGWLVQACDNKLVDDASLKIVTKRKPGKEELADLHFAWACVKHVKSNAIVIAKDKSTVGIGQGQPSRVRAVKLAINNAGEKSQGAVLASDGFFPFPDNIEFAAKAGIKAIIQPGGSIKDKEVIEAADKAGLAMIFTGMRHFRH